jgi:hypothetical protein
MRVFEASASYRSYFESSILLAMRDVAVDKDRRADPATDRVKPRIPDTFITPDVAGSMVILVVDLDDDERAIVKAIRALKSAPTTRPSAKRPVHRRTNAATNARRGART